MKTEKNPVAAQSSAVETFMPLRFNDDSPEDTRFETLFKEFLYMESHAPAAVLDQHQRLKS